MTNRIFLNYFIKNQTDFLYPFRKGFDFFSD